MSVYSNNYKLLNILIADGQKIFRDGLQLALKNIDQVEKIFHACNAPDTLNELKYNCCDLVLIDYQLPVSNGAACTREIKRLYPSTKVIGLSIYDDEEHVVNMLDNGADGYLLKNTDSIEIELAIISVINGRHYFSKDIAATVIDQTYKKIKSHCMDKFKVLNSREKEILKLLYEENSSKEIADRLYISERTVEFYRQSLIKKTGAKNIVGLIKYAICNELIEH
ncbi:MAG TPA: response regulator transcription factor [Puia sp.]|nr:response regulator transcription factor [Puia sp.]